MPADGQAPPSGPAKSPGGAATQPAGATPHPAQPSSPPGHLAAPLPRPVIKTHFNRGAGKYLFKDLAWDLGQVKKVFNTVIVGDGDARLVSEVRAAGLAAFLEFDDKVNFVKGKDISATVAAIVRQVKENPGTIAGIRVADRINEKLTPEQALRYLEATGGVFHREIPGVPIVVDVEDWELTCGLTGQSVCTAHLSDEYRNGTNEVLMRIYRSGFVDGFELSVNLKGDDPEVMSKAMVKARALFPHPFQIYSRTASLSFADGAYKGDTVAARRQVAAYIEAPLRAGADGIDLWAWHRPWKSELRTFLNKDGSVNALWDAMVKARPAAGVAVAK